MAHPAPLPAYRLKIPCADEREFRERFAPKYVASGIFVPAKEPLAVGTRVHIKLEFKGGQVLVSGDAMVTSRTPPEKSDKPGMTMRLTALHPTSIQFGLSPSGPGATPATPALTPAPPPLGAALTPSPRHPAVAPAPPPRPALTPSPPARSVTPPPMVPAAAPPAPSSHPLRAADREDLFKFDEEAAPPPAPAPVETADFEELEPTPPRGVALAATPEPAEDEAARGPAVAPPAPPEADEPSEHAAEKPPVAGRRPTLRIAVAVAIVAVVGATAAAIGGSRKRGAGAEASSSRATEQPRSADTRLAEELRLADVRLVEGRLAGSGGDAALDHLLAAQAASPDDARVKARLGLLADKFEQLGELALARKNVREAAVHFEAAVRADPSRASARKRLSEAESAGSALSE